jgi:ubiquinone/menaquinone biosynthesis C-methylase UbiE
VAGDRGLKKIEKSLAKKRDKKFRFFFEISLFQAGKSEGFSRLKQKIFVLRKTYNFESFQKICSKNKFLCYNLIMFLSPDKIVENFNLQAGMKVADFGSSIGTYAILMSKKVGKDGLVYAVDVQKDLLTRLKNDAEQHKIENIEVVWGDIELFRGTKLLDNSIDFLLISNTLFLVDDKEGLIKESVRVLKNHGRIALVEWSSSFGGLGPKDYQIVKRDIAEVLFEKHGVELAEEIPVGDHHYGLIFKKN